MTVPYKTLPYESHGRTGQKARTKQVLTEAARSLLAEGITPNVADAAERAGVARATAYRYFPDQDSLLLAVYPELDATSLLGPEPPADAAARLDRVIENLTNQVRDHEPELRATLRVALDPRASRERLPLRQGRAIRWIGEALAPLQDEVPASQLHELALAIRVSTGIEAFVWLTDVGGLSADDAVGVMRRSARALLRSALEDAGRPLPNGSDPR
jgi:AcrR family transcriptional regulator